MQSNKQNFGERCFNLQYSEEHEARGNKKTALVQMSSRIRQEITNNNSNSTNKSAERLIAQQLAKQTRLQNPPGSARITQLESVAVKGETVTLSCQLDDLGHPPASRYLWESPTRTLGNNSNQILSMGKVNASAEGVYFCAGRNEVGTGPLGHFTLKLRDAQGASPLPVSSVVAFAYKPEATHQPSVTHRQEGLGSDWYRFARIYEMNTW
ncbi:hypothetical protein AVEN_119540-1 [Araneus ventricosus]|uniref:Ig-like domain-containing protein n=1 Tax=Araneus ventricosus TaxID=182803 RepID=A0A4Y2JEC6_ARAVE|nr:hypothetical protein AVEN_119540-1 [Araneus ventricosus]